MDVRAGRLLVATRNPGKFAELTALLGETPFTLTSLAEVDVVETVEETGDTLEENATLKARAYSALSHLPTLADDSGLEVEALGGEPGPLSARYAGEGAGDAKRLPSCIESSRMLETSPGARGFAV